MNKLNCRAGWFFSFIAVAAMNVMAFDPIAHIERAIVNGEKNITLPQGKYKLETKKSVYLELKGLKDVTIDFGGSTFWGTKKTRMISVECCTNVVLKNLVIDYPFDLPFTQAVIKEVDADKNWNVEVIDGYPSPKIPAAGAWPIQAYDKTTHELKNPMRFQDHLKMWKSGKRTYRIEGGEDRRGDVGDICVFSLPDDPDEKVKGDVSIGGSQGVERHAVCVMRSMECKFVDMTAYSTPMGRLIEELFCDGNEYHRCVIDRCPERLDPVKRGLRRLRSGNHDAFMSRGSARGPKIINCTAKYHCDDCVNITGAYNIILGCENGRLRVVASPWGEGTMNVGDSCQVITPEGRALKDVTVKSVAASGEVTEDEAKYIAGLGIFYGHVPHCRKVYDVAVTGAEGIEKGCLILSNNACGNGAQIIGCDFGHARARGIVNKGCHVLIASNKVSNCTGIGILMRMSYHWLEGGLCEDVEIVGNECRDNGSPAVLVSGMAKGLLPAGAHRNLRFKDNVITGSKVAFDIVGGKGLFFEGNKTDAEKVYYLRNCEDVKKD